MLIDVQAPGPGSAATLLIGHWADLRRSGALALFIKPIFPSRTDG